MKDSKYSSTIEIKSTKENRSLLKLPKTKVNCILNKSVLLPAAFNKNECPSTLFYSPTFLSIDNSFLNGFPINQEIGCHGAKIILKCPQNHFIYLLAGYYGIQSRTVTFFQRFI